MRNEKKYNELKEFFLENFIRTEDINDRLHTRDIINIAYNNKFLFSDCKIAETFKSLNLGEHRTACNINKKIHSGYYFLKHRHSE